MSLNGEVHALVVCFGDDSDELNLKGLWGLAYRECGSEHMQSSALKDGDRDWAIGANDAMDIDDGDDAPDEFDYRQEEEDQLNMNDFPASSNIRVGGQAARDQEAEVAAASSAVGSGAQNDNLAVGMRLNRTFVNRGSQIGVFKHDDQGSLQYLNNVPVVKDMSGQAFAPSKMLLHDEDGKMLLLNEEKKGNVYEFDLEYGKVVQEYVRRTTTHKHEHARAPARPQQREQNVYCC